MTLLLDIWDIEDEIQTADRLDRLKLERKENILIQSLKAFAVFFVPVSAISSVYGGSSKNIEELDPSFWWISIGVTVAALVSVFFWWKWLDNKIKNRGIGLGAMNAGGVHSFEHCKFYSAFQINYFHRITYGIQNPFAS